MLELNFGDVATVGAAGLAGLLTLVEIAPVKWKPWTAIGKLTNRAVLDELHDQKSKNETWMRDVNEKISELRDLLDESEAKAARMRIQRFADEMYIDIRHSREHFDLILMDITAYNHYCDEHPDFVNEKTKVAQGVIKEAYKKCIRDRSFRE